MDEKGLIVRHRRVKNLSPRTPKRIKAREEEEEEGKKKLTKSNYAHEAR